jgi:hypothetical protein
MSGVDGDSFAVPAYRVSWFVKLPMLLIVTLMMGWTAVENYVSETREHAPTRIPIQDMESEYRGQRWVSVTGRLQPERMDVREAGEASGTQFVAYVPIVPEGSSSRPEDPLWSVAVVGPFSSVMKLV